MVLNKIHHIPFALFYCLSIHNTVYIGSVDELMLSAVLTADSIRNRLSLDSRDATYIRLLDILRFGMF